MKESVEAFESAINSLREETLKVLSRTGKDLDITFEGKSYSFGQAFTRDEYNDLNKKKTRLINRMIRNCFIRYLGGDPKAFSLILALDSGIKIEDFQVEKINESDAYKVVNESGDAIKSVALDTETIYVQSQRPDLDFEDESIRNYFMAEWQEKRKQKDVSKDMEKLSDAQEDKEDTGGV